MTKIIKLTEADLTRIIKRVTKEQMVREDFPAGPQKAGSTVGLGMDNPTGPQNAGATGTTNVSPRIQNIVCDYYPINSLVDASKESTSHPFIWLPNFLFIITPS